MELRTALFGVGYPVSVVVISRFVPVVRQQRWPWLLAHHLGVVAVMAGWALAGRASAVAFNGAWLVTSSVWYVLGRRR